MKRILPLMILFILASSASYAGVFIDTQGMYSHSWSTHEGDDSINRDNCYGALVGLGYYIHEQVNIRVAGGYFYSIPVRETVDGDYTAQAMGFFFSLEFIPYIPLLSENRLFLLNNLTVGYTNTTVDFDTDMMEETGDTAIQLMLSVGILFQWTQHIAPYFTMGWTGIYYQGDWKESDTNQLLMTLGVRFFLYSPRTLQ